MSSIAKNSFAFLLFFCLSLLSFAQQKTLTVEQMRADIDSMVRIIEEIHINPYYKYSKEKFSADIESLKRNLNAPKDIIEFWKDIAPIVAKLEDGHTEVNFPTSYFDQLKVKLFPYPVKTSMYAPYFIISKGDSIVPENAEVVSINNISSNDMIRELIKYISAEEKETRARFLASRFRSLACAILNIKDSCELKYKMKGIVFTKKIYFLTKEQYLKKISSNETSTKLLPYTLKIIPNLKTAVIDLRIFDNPNYMKQFADSTFTLIKNSGIKNLIIDIRYNGGGNSEVGDVLIPYFANSDFRQHNKIIVKYSNQYREQRWIGWKKQILNKKVLSERDSTNLNFIENLLKFEIGKIDQFELEPIKLETLENRFFGNVFVLTSKQTFSSATSFAQTIKAHNMGKIIGEETGGWIVTYGDKVSDKLLFSNLTLSVSSKKFILQGANENDWHGVIPDIKIESSKSMDYVLQLIKEQLSKGK